MLSDNVTVVVYTAAITYQLAKAELLFTCSDVFGNHIERSDLLFSGCERWTNCDRMRAFASLSSL